MEETVTQNISPEEVDDLLPEKVENLSPKEFEDLLLKEFEGLSSKGKLKFQQLLCRVVVLFEPL